MRSARSSHAPELDGAATLDEAQRNFSNRGDAPNSINGFSGRGAIGFNNLVQQGVGALERYGPKLAGEAANGASWLRDQADGLDRSAASWPETMKRIEANTSPTAKNTKDALEANKDNMKYMGNMLDVLSRTMAYVGQDATLALVR